MLTCCVLRDALERACIAFSEVLNGYLLADLVRPRNRLWTMLAIPPVRNPSGAFHALRSRNSKEIDRDGLRVILNAAVNALISRAQNRYPEGRLSRAPERRPASVDCIYCCYDQNDQGRVGTSPPCWMLRRGRQRAINAGPIWPPSRGRSLGGCDLQRAAQAMTAVGSELINDDGSLAFLSAVRAHRPQSRIINAYSSCIREVSIGPPRLSKNAHDSHLLRN